jgi:hypothetical protein
MSPSEISYLCRMSRSLSAWSKISDTKSQLPKILSSPFSRSSLFLPRRPALSPPALRTSPPTCSSGRVPWATPFLMNCRYLLRATVRVSPKWQRTSSIVFSARDFDSLTPVRCFALTPVEWFSLCRIQRGTALRAGFTVFLIAYGTPRQSGNKRSSR